MKSVQFCPVSRIFPLTQQVRSTECKEEGRENPVQFTVENSACVENSDTVHGQWGGVSPVLLMSSNLGL